MDIPQPLLTLQPLITPTSDSVYGPKAHRSVLNFILKESYNCTKKANSSKFGTCQICEGAFWDGASIVCVMSSVTQDF